MDYFDNRPQSKQLFLPATMTNQKGNNVKLVEVHDLCKEFVAADGNKVSAIHMVSFGVDQGEFLTIVGPSGSGKTTLVKMVAGLINPTKGSVRIHGLSTLGPPKELSMVFQD